MKRCDICGSPASVFLTQVTDGKTKDIALCRACAGKRGIFEPGQLNVIGGLFPREISGEVEKIIRSMLAASLADRTPENEVTEEFSTLMPDALTECPACRYPIENYRQTGMLGCPECYRAFSPEFNETIVPDNTSPALRTPASAKQDREGAESTVNRCEQLRELLHKAVQAENYEEAARLRDQIRNIPRSS